MASASRGRGADLGFTCGVIAAIASATPASLYVAIAWAREPVWDGHYYDFGAKRIAAGLGYSDDAVVDGLRVWHPWCHYPVGYSGFLALVYRVFGSGPHVATVANAVAGALLVAVVHRLARHATTPGRARLAAVFTALSPGLIVYSALLMTEPLAALGIVASAWLFVRDPRPVPRGLAAGVVLGLTALVRPQSLLCVPALSPARRSRAGRLAWKDRASAPRLAPRRPWRWGPRSSSSPRGRPATAG